MVKLLRAGLSLAVAVALACATRAQQLDYYFLIPPDANNIDQPYLELVAGQTFEARWHNPGNPINLYLTWCDGLYNLTLLDGVENTGQAPITLDNSSISECGDYTLTVLGVQHGVMNWGQPTGTLPFDIVNLDYAPNMVASLTTIEVTDTDPVGFAAATAVLSVAVSPGDSIPTTTTSSTSSSSTDESGLGGIGGGSGSDGGESNGASATSTSSNSRPSTTLSTVASGTDSTTGSTGAADATNDSGLTPEARVGTAVGIGLGVPLLALPIVFAWLWNRRKRPASAAPAPSPYGIETTEKVRYA